MGKLHYAQLEKLRDGINKGNQELNLEQKAEEEAALAAIREKYSNLKGNGSNSLKEVEDSLAEQYRLLEQLSSFDAIQVSKYIAILMSIMEGTSYEVHGCKNYTFRKVNVDGEIKESDDFDKINNALAIIRKEYVKDSYYAKKDTEEEFNIEKLVRSGKMMVISNDLPSSLDGRVSFYTFDEHNLRANEFNSFETFVNKFNFGGFTYVEDYINALIDYKDEHDLEDLTDFVMFDCLKKVIVKNGKTLGDNYLKKVPEPIKNAVKSLGNMINKTIRK